MSKLAELKGRHGDVMSRLTTLAGKAAADGDLSDAELDEAKSLREEAAELKTKVAAEEKAYTERQEKFDRLLEVAPSKETKADAPAKSLGEGFVDSREYKSMRARIQGTGLVGNWTSGAVELKATVSETASPIIQPAVRGGIVDILQRPLMVADLMPSLSTSSNVVRYLQETTATNAAAETAEEGAKPESTLIFASVDEPVRKIATFLPVSDEMLEDESQIRSYIDSRLGLFVRLREDSQLLNGNGTPPNLRGIYNRSGLTAATSYVTATSRVGAVLTAKLAVETASLLAPDAMVIHPTDWSLLVREKESASGTGFYGAFYVGNPYDTSVNSLSGPSIWGMRVVVTSAAVSGTPLIGNFREGAAIWRRSGLVVEASNSHSDFFQKNLTAIRAEERLALAVYRPAAFTTITTFQA